MDWPATEMHFLESSFGPLFPFIHSFPRLKEGSVCWYQFLGIGMQRLESFPRSSGFCPSFPYYWIELESNQLPLPYQTKQYSMSEVGEGISHLSRPIHRHITTFERILRKDRDLTSIFLEPASTLGIPHILHLFDSSHFSSHLNQIDFTTQTSLFFVIHLTPIPLVLL